MRVISVHDILGSPSLLTPRQNHKWLESLNSIFGQPLMNEHWPGAAVAVSVIAPMPAE